MEIREIIRDLPQWVINLLRKDPSDGQMILLASRGDTLIGRVLINCDDLDCILNVGDAPSLMPSAFHFKGLCYTNTIQRAGNYNPFSCDHCKQGKPEGWLLFINTGKVSICSGCVFNH